MIRRLLPFFLALFSLLPCARSEVIQPSVSPYKLEPVEWLDKDADYTIISNKTPIIADPLMLALMGDEDDHIGLSANMEQIVVSGESLLEQGFHVLSVAPDGQRFLCSEGSRLYLLMGNTLRAVALNLSRCVATQREGMQQSIFYANKQPTQIVGSEGFRWSPDGKYLFVLNGMVSVRLGSIPLMLIDAEKGEMFSIRAYQRDGYQHATAMQGVFSPDSQYLYYTELVGWAVRLCRYDLARATHELLIDTHQGLVAFPGLGMNAQGEIVSLMGWQNTMLLTTFKEGSTGWSFRQEALPSPFSVNFMHFHASGSGSLIDMMSLRQKPVLNLSIGGRRYRLEVKPDDKQQTILFSLKAPFETMKEIEANREEWEWDKTEAGIYAVMMPSGSRYLLMTGLNKKDAITSYWLMDVQTGETVSIQVPEEMETPRSSCRRGNDWYQPGITFLTDDLLLVPGAENQTQLYRLVCENPFK
ncbi:MAG: TolB family protein [Christensenellales bacterium]|jgi:hypothetical protein